jgi:hypothetical protein
MAPFAALCIATMLGVVLNAYAFSPAHGAPGYSMYVFWSLINASVLALAAMACVEPPHRRRDERFFTSENVTVRMPTITGEDLTICGITKDLSLGGAAIRCTDQSVTGWRALAGPAELLIWSKADQAELALPFTVVDRKGDLLKLQFHDDKWIRHALIKKLFTGDYHKDVEAVHAGSVFLALARDLIS